MGCGSSSTSNVATKQLHRREHGTAVENVPTGKQKKGELSDVTNTKENYGRESEQNSVKASAELVHGCGESSDNIKETDLKPRPPKLKKKDLLKGVDFTKTDQHARQAPKQFCRSLPDLVNYLSSNSRDPLFLVRSFFVWIAKNIRYDVEGFFGGLSESTPSDYKSVMLSGKSVCEGYANVMKEMCRQAGIPARKLSGFSKGYGYAPENPFTTNTRTDHAWNAVYLRGNWFLLDNTWGAGHVTQTNEYKAEFTEFYFLTDPEMFVSAHFPYEKGDENESLKWQLLAHPVSLDDFNRSLDIRPAAFDIGILPSSHKSPIIEFNDEIELTFKEELAKANTYTTILYRKEGNMLYGERCCCYLYFSGGMFRVKIKPPLSGSYTLKIFGKKLSASQNELSLLFEYKLKCTVPSTDTGGRRFPYPETFGQTLEDECHILEPLGKPILSRTAVKMRFKSPVLAGMMVNDWQMLKKQGDVFEGMITAPDSGRLIQVFGSRSDTGPSGKYHGVYSFRVI